MDGRRRGYRESEMAARIAMANMANTIPALGRGLEGLPDMNRGQGRGAAAIPAILLRMFQRPGWKLSPGSFRWGGTSPWARATILDSYAAFRRTW